MSETATQLLATFESLPANEQHELMIAMLRTSGELPDASIADDQLTGLADELFQTLDAEESNGNATDAHTIRKHVARVHEDYLAKFEQLAQRAKDETTD